MSDTTNCLGYQQIASGLNAANSLTLPTHPTGITPSRVLITPEAQAVRWRDDGTAPTSTVGMPLAVGDTLEYDGNLNKIQFIEQAASAKLNISYYR